MPETPDEPEEMVEVEVDLAQGRPLKNPMEELLNTVPAVADMKLDLTKDEKLRATALMLAVRYHADTVVKEGELYQQMKMDQKTLTPTSAQKVVEYAWHFEKYLRGESEVAKALEDRLIARLEAYVKEKIDEDIANGMPGMGDEEDDTPNAPGGEP